MLELIAIALLQLASLTASSGTPSDSKDTTNGDPIVVVPTDNEQGGGGWGGD